MRAAGGGGCAVPGGSSAGRLLSLFLLRRPELTAGCVLLAMAVRRDHEFVAFPDKTMRFLGWKEPLP